jgi:ABC-type transport system involved in multi-copper enzyme maturation permease subunit
MTEFADTNFLAARPFNGPTFTRLVQIELRKSIDTRAGFWLLVGSALLTVAAAVVRGLAGDAAEHGFRSVLEAAVSPTNVLLPVVGVLLITSEWSQRTALATFSQVPNRLRVVAAKCTAGIALGLAFFAISVAVAAVTVAVLGGDAPQQWSFGAELWLQYTGFVILGMLMGLALGALLLASAPAIVTYFAAPTVITILASLDALKSALKWVDPAAMSTPLTTSPLSSADAAHLLTSTIFWIAIPLAIGCWRIGRTDLD